MASLITCRISFRIIRTMGHCRKMVGIRNTRGVILIKVVICSRVVICRTVVICNRVVICNWVIVQGCQVMMIVIVNISMELQNRVSKNYKTPSAPHSRTPKPTQCLDPKLPTISTC